MRLHVLRWPTAPEIYRGMHRLSVGADLGTPLSLVGWASSLEAMRSAPTPQEWSEFDEEQRRHGLRYELVALDDAPQDWRLLGLDVGEVSDLGWSAIANASVFLSEEEVSQLRGRLNPHGLFSDSLEAASFLELYMSRPDPDRDWEIDEKGALHMVYAVVPVHAPPWGSFPRDPDAPPVVYTTERFIAAHSYFLADLLFQSPGEDYPYGGMSGQIFYKSIKACIAHWPRWRQFWPSAGEAIAEVSVALAAEFDFTMKRIPSRFYERGEADRFVDPPLSPEEAHAVMTLLAKLLDEASADDPIAFVRAARVQLLTRRSAR